MALKPLDLMTLTASHSRYLRCLVGEPRTPVILPGASKTIMLANLQAAEIELLQTISFIAPADYDQLPICGFWTLQDLLGHLADWDTYFLNWLAILTGRPQQDLYWNEDGDQFNAWLYERRRDKTWAETWVDFRQNRQSFYQWLTDVPDTEVLLAKENSPFPTIYHCAWSALEHYLDHAAGVRRALNFQMPDELLSFHGPYTD
ncbi:ClbS/DfsB family four-helix bundle protein [Chloroflexi bacterium TSY]|nr:ClbS/DfsB family four-helix bundle protein [Chloroflexi bacterium TSY]